MEFKRIFIEKNEEFNTEGQLLLKDFRDFLGIQSLKKVRIVNLYDLIGVNEAEKDLIVNKVLFEKNLDHKYEERTFIKENEKCFRVEMLKGQYNQREDSTEKLIKVLTNREDIKVLNSKIIILENINEDELEKIKNYYINPIEMKEVDVDSFNFVSEEEKIEDVEIIEGFINMNEKDLASFKSLYGIGMDMEDLQYCQAYFKDSEDRNPSITELKLIDTYWSDHCRHTTFMTEITDISIEEGKYEELFQGALNEYIESRKYVYEDRDKVISLMDLGTINSKEIAKKGLLDDKEVSEEVNAASIEIDVDIDGKNEKWLLMFKNETHNHPTEMEPFGGAATCLGGAIRDPLSGRAYVYQAMRITGSGDPRTKYEKTLAGKLPQRKITQTARDGYSSYGYEIGAATGYVKEIYDPGYLAKRMELGALVAAAPKEAVYRGSAEPGDVVVLVGGRTGRDGLGGAVGSSQGHSQESLETSHAEVQKGNPAMERKIVRLFRNKEVSKMIKICNDFGAGGVSVAIGELADGLSINLDKVPLKYPGLDGSEIALSESQERMAVVIDKNDLDKFMKFAREEDVESTVVANVTEEKALKINWRGKEIVNIKRDFLDTNGIRKKSKINVVQPEENSYFENDPLHIEGKDIKLDFINNMKDLNTSSQKGLIEGFDHTVGSGSILMPLGGEYKLTPAEGMVAKIPVLDGETSTCSLMTYGYDPKMSKWSPFHGGYYAVIHSIAKIVAMGGSHEKIRLTFQEYFERLEKDESKWGKPFSALLGAYMVQKNMDAPSIGGKDSMSGSFEDIDVPPTLVSFAITTDKVENIISPEFKNLASKVALVKLDIDNDGMIDFNQLKESYKWIKKLVNTGEIISASTVEFGGMARSIAEMSMGNKIGFKFTNMDSEILFKPLYGSIVVELKGDGVKAIEEMDNVIEIGTTIEEEDIEIHGEVIKLDSLMDGYKGTLNDVFPINEGSVDHEDISYTKGNKISRKSKIVKPKVLIPIFTGTHGEYDMGKVFEDNGGDVEYFIFKSLSLKDMKESYKELGERIKSSQILAFPNGSLIGDEPETGGKLMDLILRNPNVAEAINNHLYKKDGLILGVGAGFLGLMKLGLIETGEIKDINEDSAGIIYNKDGGFLSKQVDIRVSSNLSPWFNQMNVGDVYTSPLATKEGRVIGKNLEKLIANGQISTQFINNPTGSTYGIESMTSPDGRILGTIASIDRSGDGLYKNSSIKGKNKIILSGIKYFD